MKYFISGFSFFVFCVFLFVGNFSADKILISYLVGDWLWIGYLSSLIYFLGLSIFILFAKFTNKELKKERRLLAKSKSYWEIKRNTIVLNKLVEKYGVDGIIETIDRVNCK